MIDSTERARLALRVPSLVREACYIGGQWVSGKGSIPVYNPATGRITQVPAGELAHENLGGFSSRSSIYVVITPK